MMVVIPRRANDNAIERIPMDMRVPPIHDLRAYTRAMKIAEDETIIVGQVGKRTARHERERLHVGGMRKLPTSTPCVFSMKLFVRRGDARARNTA